MTGKIWEGHISRYLENKRGWGVKSYNGIGLGNFYLHRIVVIIEKQVEKKQTNKQQQQKHIDTDFIYN